MMKYRYQLVSDAVRDGMGLELTDDNWAPIAEVFRCDAAKTLTISLCVEGLPFTEIERLVLMAKKGLAPFEDGTPLPGRLELDG